MHFFLKISNISAIAFASNLVFMVSELIRNTSIIWYQIGTWRNGWENAAQLVIFSSRL